MATSAFKSTTKRGGTSSSSSSSSTDCSAAYNRNVPRGKFVNTTRGSGVPFPEIGLDDLAPEFFSSSSTNDNESDGGLWERNEGPGRSLSRLGEVGRWASDTASSKRRARSVSKSRGSGVVVSSSSTSGNENEISKGAGSRWRRSLSVARFQISDSESEVDNFQKSSKQAAVKAPASWEIQSLSGQKTTTSSNWHLGRSRNHKNCSILHDGYCSEHPIPEVATGGLYEAMRQEIRYAVEEIRTELNQTMGRNQIDVASCDYLKAENSGTFQEFSGIEEKCASKFEERSSNGSRISQNLIEEAERIFEDFICNVEDADVSSFDGERSDGSSTLGGSMKTRDSATTEIASMKTRDSATTEIATHETIVEMDGVMLPWLQWETGEESILLGKNKVQSPVTPKALLWDSEKDMALPHYPSMYSLSSQECWSPGIFQGHVATSEDANKNRKVLNDSVSSFDMDEYLNLQNSEDLLFETYRQRNRINLGG